MAEYLDNPAGRLLAILQKAKLLASEKEHANWNAYVGWGETFAISTTRKSGQAEVFRRITIAPLST